MEVKLENHDSEFSLLPVWSWHQSLMLNISPIITSHKKCVVWHFKGIAIPLLDSHFHKYHFCSTILLQKSMKKHKRYSLVWKRPIAAETPWIRNQCCDICCWYKCQESLIHFATSIMALLSTTDQKGWYEILLRIWAVIKRYCLVLTDLEAGAQ